MKTCLRVRCGEGSYAVLYAADAFLRLAGKLEARLRDHASALFETHGIAIVGHWTIDVKEKEWPNLIYLLAHKSQEAAKASFDTFLADTEGRKP